MYQYQSADAICAYQKSEGIWGKLTALVLAFARYIFLGGLNT